jgi:hypothetical protein
MPFTLMIKAEDHGGFLLDGPHTSNTIAGGISNDSTGNGTLSVFHPPPPGPDKKINLQQGDKVVVSANGDLFLVTQTDPSEARCTPKDWAEMRGTGYGAAGGNS